MMNDTIAIVVTYNRKDMLLGCVEHLLQLNEIHADILVVDNASTDGTKEALVPFIADNKVIYVNTGKNLGGAGGFQFGMNEAMKLNYKYLWLMDDDTYPSPDSLKELFAADRSLNGEYGFLSSIAKWKDGNLCNMNIQKTSIKEKIEDYSGITTPVIMATFVSFFVKADIVKEFGLPIKEFFIWSDDLEYSRRISRKYPCYTANQSLVLHNMASNEKVGIEKESSDRLWRYSYLYRNEVYVYRREGIKGRWYLFLRVHLHLMRVLLKAKEGRAEKLKVIWKAYHSGKKFDPPIHFPGEDLG